MTCLSLRQEHSLVDIVSMLQPQPSGTRFHHIFAHHPSVLDSLGLGWKPISSHRPMGLQVKCELRKCEWVFCELKCEPECDWSDIFRPTRSLPGATAFAHSWNYLSRMTCMPAYTTRVSLPKEIMIMWLFTHTHFYKAAKIFTLA